MRGSGSSEKRGSTVRDTFIKALDALVDEIKRDRSVLAASPPEYTSGTDSSRAASTLRRPYFTARS